MAGDEEFFAEVINVSEGSALVFISRNLLQVAADSKELFIDGTFRTIPSLFYQLVTIHVTAYSKVTFNYVCS